LELVGLVIKKGRSRWFGHIEDKDDSDWIKHWSSLQTCPARPGHIKLP